MEAVLDKERTQVSALEKKLTEVQASAQAQTVEFSMARANAHACLNWSLRSRLI